ncbi:hypothetical protein HII31_12990 [Pseudocercospora fuligena]|uniref:Uncharacterized protein n=1 Tax=Pseudocercospora fuligena TaxID=685502 RepID=A0A8H6R5T0_9PEZI|nr:hypothetical protein HII31_12990 [Pseudocercospora fuligena]
MRKVAIYGWPSRGGVIILDDAQAIDLEFLGLDPLNPQLERDADQDSEDEFCQRLLLLGAKWWDSCARQIVVERFDKGDGDPTDDHRRGIGRGPHPFPTMREKRWVCVAWPSNGGFWISEFDIHGFGENDPDSEIPEECPGLAKVKLARSMDERAEILREEFKGKWFRTLEEYEGMKTFLRAWEWKSTGEVGRRMLSVDEMWEEWRGNLRPIVT